MPLLSPKAAAWATAVMVVATDIRLLFVAAIVIALFVGGVVLPAVWSRKGERRRAAHALVKTIMSSFLSRR
jgi:hypothetical protein